MQGLTSIGSMQGVTAFSQAFPQASLLLTGVADPGSRLHAENESVDLGGLERGSVAGGVVTLAARRCRSVGSSIDWAPCEWL
jgi:hypothetical protein